MRQIRMCVYIFAFISALGIAIDVLLIIFDAVSVGIPVYLVLAALFFGSVVAAIYCAYEHRRLKIARIIVGNAILHIRTAVVDDAAGGVKQEDAAAEVFVSYFGILLESRIIKFNQDGVQLTAVEFGLDYVSLTYGSGGRLQSTRLLRPVIPCEELLAIADKFRYETGVVPTVNL